MSKVLPIMRSIYYSTEIREWLIAVGTIGAVLVALFGEAIRRWHKRPRLEIEFENSPPCCATVQKELIFDEEGKFTGKVRDRKSYHIRVRVRNIGRSVAKSCKGEFVEIMHKDKKSSREDFYPVMLSWPESPTGYSDINPKESEYLALLTTYEDNDIYQVEAFNKSPRWINLQPKRDDYYLRVVIYSENAKPVFKTFYVKNAECYDKITMTEDV